MKLNRLHPPRGSLPRPIVLVAAVTVALLATACDKSGETPSAVANVAMNRDLLHQVVQAGPARLVAEHRLCRAQPA